jgi:hypothetical protein
MTRLKLGAVDLVTMLTTACAQADLSVDTPETGVGKVTALETLADANAAVYGPENKDYKELRFGKLNASFIEIDSHRYVADWNQLDVYKQLKVGDKVGFSSTGRLVRLETSGGKDGNYRQITVSMQ